MVGFCFVFFFSPPYIVLKLLSDSFSSLKHLIFGIMFLDLWRFFMQDLKRTYPKQTDNPMCFQKKLTYNSLLSFFLRFLIRWRLIKRRDHVSENSPLVTNYVSSGLHSHSVLTLLPMCFNWWSKISGSFVVFYWNVITFLLPLHQRFIGNCMDHSLHINLLMFLYKWSSCHSTPSTGPCLCYVTRIHYSAGEVREAIVTCDEL